MSKKEVFEVAVFDSFDDSGAIVMEGGLSYDNALEKATNLFETGEHYGVEIIDQDPNNMEPIVWIMTKDVDDNFDKEEK
jgi:hypothetical protein